METAHAERVLDALGDPTRRLVFKRLRNPFEQSSSRLKLDPPRLPSIRIDNR
jgi:hypothetical protein